MVKQSASVPIPRRIHPKVMRYVSAEIGGRGEAEHIGNLYERKALVPKQTGDVERRITIDPKVGGITAHSL